LDEKSGTVALVLPDLMADWLAGWLAGRQNSAKFKIFKNYIPDKIFEFLLCLTKVQCYYRRTNRF